MYVNGIDNRADVQRLLSGRGYQWCSTKYSSTLPFEEMQPYKLDEFLLEIPCTGLSERNYFYDVSVSIEGFIKHVVAF